MSVINQQHMPDDPYDRYLLSIDSSDRNIIQYPNANKYGIELPHEYRGIRRIQLLTTEFTCTQYAISNTNNIIVVSHDSGASYSALTVTPGTYNGTQLALKLATLLATIWIGGASVEFSEVTNKLTFGTSSALGVDVLGVAASQDPTNAAFQSSGLIWNTIGMGRETTNPVVDMIGPVEYVTLDRVNLDCDRYIIMEITFPRIMQGFMRTTGEHHNCFAKIIFDSPGSVFSNVYDFVSAPVKFQKISRLTHIEFTFRRPNGNLWDFHNQNHSFTLQITTQ